jgi:hypothetical protein
VSDFLSRLAERALGSDPPVRPRLGSLFEPERPGFADGLDWMWAPQAGGEVEVPRLGIGVAAPLPGGEAARAASGEPAGGPWSPASVPARAILAQQGSELGSGRAGMSAPAATSPARGTAARSWPAAESPGGVAPAVLPSLSEPDQAGSAASGEAAPHLSSHREMPGGPGAAFTAPVSSGGFMTRPGRLGLRAEGRPAPPVPRGQAPGGPLRGSGVSRAPQVPPAQRFRSRDRYQGAAIPDPEPVINITIGRIDVRAWPPSESGNTAKPAPRSGPGPLSLDEYLRRRGEGR